MAEQYGFKRKACYCGLDLTGKKAEATGLWRDTQPVGKCPNCGRDMLLDAPPIKPAQEAPAALAAAPAGEAAASPKRSRSSK